MLYRLIAAQICVLRFTPRYTPVALKSTLAVTSAPDNLPQGVNPEPLPGLRAPKPTPGESSEPPDGLIVAWAFRVERMGSSPDGVISKRAFSGVPALSAPRYR